MAVIRQQTQVFNKPVGVRRINTGEAELWEQVAATADEFRNRAYKKAAVDAEQAGKIAKLANVRQLIIGHYSGRYKNIEAFKTEAQEIFENTFLAETGKVFEIN